MFGTIPLVHGAFDMLRATTITAALYQILANLAKQWRSAPLQHCVCVLTAALWGARGGVKPSLYPHIAAYILCMER